MKDRERHRGRDKERCRRGETIRGDSRRNREGGGDKERGGRRRDTELKKTYSKKTETYRETEEETALLFIENTHPQVQFL